MYDFLAQCIQTLTGYKLIVIVIQDWVMDINITLYDIVCVVTVVT